MIAVALSGGVDSAAAAILLHEKGEAIAGFTLYLGTDTPPAVQIDRAGALCRHLSIPHHIIDVSSEFKYVKDYFCNEYLAGRTPNPCAICNRDIKFGVLLERAFGLGAEAVATGHYVRKSTSSGRNYLGKAFEASSQEYFLGLVPQGALERSIFPLAHIPRKECEKLVEGIGIEIPRSQTSQDACFLGDKDYVSFIRSYTGYVPVQGDILNSWGSVVGRHDGMLRYTQGQRKGLGVGLGRRVYVLDKDAVKNTITVGPHSQWTLKGFTIKAMNFMKLPSLEEPLEVRVKVRYRQEPQRALIRPKGLLQADVEYEGIFSPGQLAVFYDRDDSVLCAGIIEYGHR